MRQAIKLINRIVILSIAGLFFIGTLHAATFTVGVVLDGSDANPGNGICATSIGNCTLRAAIEEANAFPGTDTIAFGINGAGVKTIIPSSEYPEITEPITIDGWTQGGAGYTGSPLIEIDGTNAGAVANGLLVATGNSTIRGLAINRFAQYAIQLYLMTGGNTIQGCYIGTDATGNIDLGNLVGIRLGGSGNNVLGGSIPAHRNLISGNDGFGITIDSDGNTISGNYIGTNASGTSSRPNGNGIQLESGATANIIGGTMAGERNVISGNRFSGVRIDNLNGSGTGANTIIGNYIGTDATGSVDVGNVNIGIDVGESSNNRIGGTAAGERNVISGNGIAGVAIKGEGNKVVGNYIGTDSNGTVDLGNDNSGVRVDDSSNNQIGGTLAGEPNIIAFNGTGVGIFNLNPAAADVGNSIRGNSIFSNSGLGIDLTPTNGVTVNDTDDPDTGANNLQNFPVLTDASTSGGSTTVQASLNSTPSTSFKIDFYSNTACDSSGYGEGENYIGSKTITTDAGGDAAFSFTPGSPVQQGKFITTTATRSVAPLDTSEFSECVQVVNPNSTIVTNTNDLGLGSLREAIINANAANGFDTIKFNIPGAGVHTIALLSPLPVISDSVVINGTTQPGYNGFFPLIELNGAGAGADGLNIQAGLSTVKGLIINRFDRDGIRLTNNGGNTITNCYIGTNAVETLDRGNNRNGIFISSPDNRIGGANLSAHNLISGNNSNGISIAGPTASGNRLIGNFIGTEINGTVDLGNSDYGVSVVLASNNVIGGSTPGERNVISGNDVQGILLLNAGGNKVKGNFIGTDSLGTSGLGNTFGGVNVSTSSTNNIIGGTLPGEGNTIAFNERGIFLESSATGNSIRGNSIFSNNTLGIDLSAIGVTANDPDDPDTGANNLQNFPVLLNVFNIGGNTNIQGALNSTPNTAFTIEFFSSPSCDSSGNGEGEVYIGSTQTATGGGGNATFTFTPANQVPLGRFITTTATRNIAPFDTSEFSACSAVTPGPGNLTFSSATYNAGEGVGARTITVNRIGGSNGQITVNYATSNGTATAGQDYTATSGTLTFLSGETVKTFDIPITNDTLDEPSETVNLTLSNPSFGVSLTPNATAVLTIVDNDNPPTISITDVSLEEGNSGTTNYTFTVNLSAPSGFDISVNYATANGTATSGIDYAPTSGTLNFSAASAETSNTVTVAVNGDLTVELNETFFLNLSNPTNAAFGDNQGLGTILDDDNPGKFSFSFAPYSGVENTQVLVTVSRTNGDAGTVSVDYSTSGGSATAFADYTPASGTLIFGDGDTTRTFTVNLLDDPQPEPTENFNVVLSNPIGGAILGVPSVASVNILDNDSGTLLIIAGEILRVNGTPLIGATVNLTGAQTATTTTNSLGRYSFPNLAPNGNYAVTPAALGFTFNPINRQYTNLTADVTNANFTATAAPTRQLRIVGGNAMPMQNITAIVELVAQGDENSVAFSLNFDQTILMNPTVILNADAATASIFVNTSQAGTGKLGILLALPAGQSFTAGTRSLVTVTFNTMATNLYGSPVTFGDIPIVKQTANTNADPLPTNYLDGAVTFAQGWEADLAPRPTGNNNGTVTVTDFTQVGRFAAGLDTNYQLNEFQRADCAPRVSLGNGVMSVTDYTQAGRYAAGLDAATPTGGQYAPSLFEFDDVGKLLSKSSEISDENNLLAPTVVRVINIDASSGTQVVVSIETIAQGTENGFGFTLNYDGAKLSNPLVALGAGVPANSTLIPNTLTAGRVGVILGLPFGVGLSAGTKQLVTIRFDVAANAASGLTALTFGDVPVVREVSDVNAQPLPSDFQNGAVNILGPTAATVSIGGRVMNTFGREVFGASVALTDSNGNQRTTRTNGFGYYRFAEVTAGETYVLTVTSKWGEYFPQVVSVNDDRDDINFIANQKSLNGF